MKSIINHIIIPYQKNGFNVFTDFSDKIFVNKNNINYLIKKTTTSKSGPIAVLDDDEYELADEGDLTSGEFDI